MTTGSPGLSRRGRVVFLPCFLRSFPSCRSWALLDTAYRAGWAPGAHGVSCLPYTLYSHHLGRKKIRFLKLSLLWEMLFADKEHFTTTLEGVADTGNQGSSPFSSRRDAYGCQFCETRALPAKMSPYIRRKPCFESAWRKGKGVQAVSWSRDVYFCLSSHPFSRSKALPDFNPI